jgi:UPF0755 protein
MPRKQRSCLSTSLILILGLACLGALLALGGLELAPRVAAQEFGNPSDGLGRMEKATYALQLLLQRDALLTPLDPGGSSRVFHIDQGESVNAIVIHMENSGLIQDAGALRNYLIYSGLDKTIKAGDYPLSPASTAVEIGRAIQDPTPRQATLRILPGWRLEEVAAALPYTGLSIQPDEFIRAAREYEGVRAVPGYQGTTGLEGFLYPDSYTFDRNASIQTVLDAIFQRFSQKIDTGIENGLKKQGLTLYEGLILASIVQKEAVVADEQPVIASVFLNRLNDGMKLDSDPTVQFALGYNADQKTWWKNPLSSGDLKVNSPYNTYMSSGLPPAPISNPSLSALEAVADPAQTDYYYFRARCDGSGRHSFAATYAEHINNACP